MLLFNISIRFFNNECLKKGFIKSTPSGKPFGIELVFTTENIEVDFKKAIDNGALVYENIQEKPWKQHAGYLKDNNGFLIEICTPIKS